MSTARFQRCQKNPILLSRWSPGATVVQEQAPQTESRELPETETKQEIH
jgi:hypothetical protein